VKKNILKHLAIIMDGNGRWAQKHGYRRTKGHEKGAEVTREMTVFCANHPTIETVTFYAFSTENWKRPKLEVDYLMKLLDRYLKKELTTYQEENIRFEAIGDLSAFSPKLRETIRLTMEKTRDNTRLTQVLALNYGGRDEIVRAANRVIAQGKTLSEESLSAALDTPYQDIDLLVRTSGEQRLSNYLLWQLSYSELAFTPTLWPDFTPEELTQIIADFEQRKRRFGGI
jgi:undecaprenyl diphosphate synthase